MKSAEIIEFLRRQKYGVVSSTGPRGQPQAAVVGLAFGDRGDAVFDTLGATRKARNLRRNARAAIVVWEGEKTVQLDGVVSEPRGAARKQALALYLAAFPDGADRLSWKGLTHFRFKPTWVRYSDFGAQPEPLVVELKAGFK